MAAQITGAPLVAIGAIGDIHTVQRMPFGTVVQGIDSLGGFAEYVYLKGITSTIVGSVVTFDEAGVTALLAANAVGPVAVALAIMDANTKFGWYGLTGTFPTDVVASCADNAPIGRETSDGKVGDGASSGDFLVGAVSRASTTAAAVVNCQFMRAWATDKSA